jgi:hypothetical protein
MACSTVSVSDQYDATSVVLGDPTRVIDERVRSSRCRWYPGEKGASDGFFAGLSTGALPNLELVATGSSFLREAEWSVAIREQTDISPDSKHATL